METEFDLDYQPEPQPEPETEAKPLPAHETQMQQLAQLFTAGHGSTLQQLRQIISLPIEANLMLPALVCVLDPTMPEQLKTALVTKQATGEPLPPPADRPDQLEQIKQLLLSNQSAEVICTMIAGVLLPDDLMTAFTELQRNRHKIVPVADLPPQHQGQPITMAVVRTQPTAKKPRKPKFHTISEVAAKLKVSVRTIRNRIEEGKITTTRNPINNTTYISSDELNRFLQTVQ